ncbi:MAG: membrane fusion protein (multidrug efflux system) [Sulfurimonas sp.]|jgi:membrane fusion protein (multidrug efflux system)|uniref:efflux RND transporter periplasmic adaptor subunit n=1 Tax=Sulfurimonas sp. TaxID=2022749 RepID=UPI0039E2E78F
MKYILLSIALFLNVVASEPKNAKVPASLVTTVKVKEGIANSLQNYVGTLYYDVNSNLASDSSGIVEKLYVREGQHVNKAQVLLKLESSVFEANIKVQVASLASLLAEETKQKKDLERAQALLDKDSISQSSYDTTFYTLQALSSTVDAKRAELKSMKIQLKKKTIKAPFSAIVVKRNIDIGEWVSVGSSVFTIIDPKSIEARINVPSIFLQTLSKKQKLQAQISNQDIEVTVKSIIPLANKASRTFPIKLSLKNQKNFIEGMRIDVKIPTLKKQKTLLVPRDAVIKRFGNFVVFSVIDDKAVMFPVKVINYTHNQAAISAKGLYENMKVITKGNERVFPDMLVTEKVN